MAASARPRGTKPCMRIPSHDSTYSVLQDTACGFFSFLAAHACLVANPTAMGGMYPVSPLLLFLHLSPGPTQGKGSAFVSCSACLLLGIWRKREGVLADVVACSQSLWRPHQQGSNCASGKPSYRPCPRLDPVSFEMTGRPHPTTSPL